MSNKEEKSSGSAGNPTEKTGMMQSFRNMFSSDKSNENGGKLDTNKNQITDLDKTDNRSKTDGKKANIELNLATLWLFKRVLWELYWKGERFSTWVNISMTMFTLGGAYGTTKGVYRMFRKFTVLNIVKIPLYSVGYSMVLGLPPSFYTYNIFSKTFWAEIERIKALEENKK